MRWRVALAGSRSPCLRHGLATPGGTVGDTGVGGLTLGGGIGHLMGLHGLTLDNLLAATVVTADGDVLSAGEGENADLFWALRGGGGNFGVVVDFKFRLHPVGLLLGGLLHYRLDDAAAVLTAWRELMAGAPDHLICFPQIFRIVPGEEAAMTISVAHFGGLDEGREAIRSLLETAEPVRDDVRPMYYAELQEIFGRSLFGLRNYWSGRFLRALPDELIELTVAQFRDRDVTGNVLLEPIHGAAARVEPASTAFSGRDASYNATYSSIWSDPREDERQIGWARAYSAALARWTIGGGYLNYASEAAGESLDTEFGVQRFERLRAVKRRYDPGNRFRFNHNIPPD